MPVRFYLDDDAAESRYQLAVRMTAEKIFETRCAAAFIEAALARLHGELLAGGKEELFDAVRAFLLKRQDASYREVSNRLRMRLGAIKAAIHRVRIRCRALLRKEVARTVTTPAKV